MTEQKISATTGAAPSGNRKGFAIAGLVIGIINLCTWILPICGGPVAVVGIILSALGLKSSKGLAIAGIILSGLGLVLVIANAIFGVLLSPSINNIFNQIQSSINSTGY
jgi:hypothetical protein